MSARRRTSVFKYVAALGDDELARRRGHASASAPAPARRALAAIQVDPSRAKGEPMKPSAIESFLDAAISARKIHPDDRETWRRSFEAAPDRTLRRLVEAPQNVFNEPGEEEAYLRHAAWTLKVDPSSIL